jgi:hypothetical protein
VRFIAARRFPRWRRRSAARPGLAASWRAPVPGRRRDPGLAANPMEKGAAERRPPARGHVVATGPRWAAWWIAPVLGRRFAQTCQRSANPPNCSGRWPPRIMKLTPRPVDHAERVPQIQPTMQAELAKSSPDSTSARPSPMPRNPSEAGPIPIALGWQARRWTGPDLRQRGTDRDFPDRAMRAASLLATGQERAHAATL